jgi:hypothetical protein
MALTQGVRLTICVMAKAASQWDQISKALTPNCRLVIKLYAIQCERVAIRFIR